MWTYFLTKPEEDKEAPLYDTAEEAIEAAVAGGFTPFSICTVEFGEPTHYEMKPVIVPNP